MTLESEPTPLATKWVGGLYGGSKANVGHYKMTLRTHFVRHDRQKRALGFPVRHDDKSLQNAFPIFECQMERRYKIQCTPFYYKNWCTGPFLAWILHETGDGIKHVFTLLVVEMVYVHSDMIIRISHLTISSKIYAWPHFWDCAFWDVFWPLIWHAIWHTSWKYVSKSILLPEMCMAYQAYHMFRHFIRSIVNSDIVSALYLPYVLKPPTCLTYLSNIWGPAQFIELW